MTVSLRKGPFEALFYRNYRYLWLSTLGTTLVQSMEIVILGWLTLELTNSPSLVGAVAAVRFAGMGLAPLGGVLADRFNRRDLLMLMQGGGILYAGISTLLYYTGLLQVWHLFALGLFSGAFRGVDLTTRQTMVPDVVESRHLTSAIGLLQVSQGLTAVVGALTGGYLYEIVGAGGCFALITGAFLFSGIVLTPIRLAGGTSLVAKESVWKSLAEGTRYIANDRSLSALMLLAAIANLFAFPCTVGVMAVFARDVLHVSSEGLGFLVAAEGLGGLLGSLFLSSLGQFNHKGWLLGAVAVAWPGMLAILSLSNTLPAALFVIAVAGIARGLDMALIQLLLLVWSDAGVRGRVMGVRMFVIIMLTFGNFLSGLGAAEWGAATIILFNALASMLTTLATVLWAPHLLYRPEQEQTSAVELTTESREV